MLNVPGSSGVVRAKLVDSSDGGITVESPVVLRPNGVVLIHGLEGRGETRMRIVHCQPIREGYRAGLEYETVQAPPKPAGEAVPDHYEVLQISPNADPDMIHRVYRLLAQRYHPDNADSGDESAFRAVTEAYKILSDPEKRAAYDVNLHHHQQHRWRLFDQREAAVGKLAEKAKRRGILDLLYTARRNQPAQPTMTLVELEDLLACPREHLEFSLWYLKENGLVTRTDNGRYAVTAKGVDWAEAEEAAATARGDRLLSDGRVAQRN
ncbi:MAG TPA: J domain-containing protein [Bryobacteraceae bacterium]|nr:J domain-containing protein [Bryobacteraceae bacterium]